MLRVIDGGKSATKGTKPTAAVNKPRKKRKFGIIDIDQAAQHLKDMTQEAVDHGLSAILVLDHPNAGIEILNYNTNGQARVECMTGLMLHDPHETIMAMALAARQHT